MKLPSIFGDTAPSFNVINNKPGLTPSERFNGCCSAHKVTFSRCEADKGLEYT